MHAVERERGGERRIETHRLLQVGIEAFNDLGGLGKEVASAVTAPPLVHPILP
jgi:hypothetical protein